VKGKYPARLVDPVSEAEFYLDVTRVLGLVYRHVTGWTVRVSNSGLTRFSAPIQNGLAAHPTSCKMGTVSLSRR
jgi:hypothetical protein